MSLDYVSIPLGMLGIAWASTGCGGGLGTHLRVLQQYALVLVLVCSFVRRGSGTGYSMMRSVLQSVSGTSQIWRDIS